MYNKTVNEANKVKFKKYNPNKFKNIGGYKFNYDIHNTPRVTSEESTTEEEADRPKRPEGPDQQILRELDEASRNGEFLYYDEGDGVQKLRFDYINQYVRDAIEEDDPEVHSRDILRLVITLKNIKKIKNNNKRLVLLFEQALGLTRRSSAGK